MSTARQVWPPTEAMRDAEALPVDEVVRKVAYSYVRFSTAAQHLGDSVRRQVAMAEDYCRTHGLELHPVSYRDLGVSAFKRRNIEQGALAAFIDAVKTGKVAKGSYLVVEQFDRLSRADVDIAVKLLLDLVQSGITLVTLVDGKIWNRESIKDIGNLIIAIVFMSRANNESASKAARLSHVWEQKKLRARTPGGRVVTSECPRWLKVNADKTGFDVIADKVESIKKVFAMRIGGYGIVSIVRRANEERWPVPGKSQYDPSDPTVRPVAWHTSTVGRLLKNRALLGEYQPHKLGSGANDEATRIPVGDPILGYFPAVLDEQTFLRAKASSLRKGEFPGRRDASLKNWLQGLVRCSCGRKLVRKNKNSEARPEYSRYYCADRNRGVTKCPGVAAKPLEAAVLHVVSHVAPQYFQGTARMEALITRIELLEVEIAAAKGTRDRFAEAIGMSNASVPALVKRLMDAEGVLNTHETDMAAARAELADLSGDTETVFANIVAAVRNVDSLDARAELREELSRVIEKITVHEPDGYIRVFLRGAEIPITHPLRRDANLSSPGLEMLMRPRVAADDEEAVETCPQP